MSISSSLSQSQLKYFRSLQQKKYRTQHKAFIVEGEKMVKEISRDEKTYLEVIRILAVKDFFEENTDILTKHDCLIASSKDIEKISSQSSPGRVVMEVKIPDYLLDQSELGEELNIYFESIRDPGNLGTIIRTADWFGFNKIICSPDSVDVYNPKVIQSTMGSIARVKVFYRESKEIIEMTSKGTLFQNLGTVLGGENIYELKFPDKGMIFFGNESNGLSTNIKESCQNQIGIPGAKTEPGPESLNLATSVGIVLSELNRQKLLKMKI
ncbi:MAG: RNA methyltransferase [Bacteroidales bacterium]|nr:RNA methyltransferase [Bacteroidales bacterium]